MSDIDPKAVEQAVEWWVLGQWFDLPSVYHERLELMATVSRDWLRIKSIPADILVGRFQQACLENDRAWLLLPNAVVRAALSAALSPSEEE